MPPGLSYTRLRSGTEIVLRFFLLSLRNPSRREVYTFFESVRIHIKRSVLLLSHFKVKHRNVSAMNFGFYPVFFRRTSSKYLFVWEALFVSVKSCVVHAASAPALPSQNTLPTFERGLAPPLLKRPFAWFRRFTCSGACFKRVHLAKKYWEACSSKSTSPWKASAASAEHPVSGPEIADSLKQWKGGKEVRHIAGTKR